MTPPAMGRCAFLISLGLLCVYLASAPGRVESIDGQMRLEVAAALLRDGRPTPAHTDYLRLVSIERTAGRPSTDKPARISYYGIGHSLLGLPILGLVRLFHGSHVIAEIAFSLLNPFIGAACAGVYLLLLGELGIGLRLACAAALCLGLCTPLWPSALTTAEAPQVALYLMLLCLALVRRGQRPAGDVRPLCLGGLAFGALLITRETDAVAALPLLAALALNRERLRSAWVIALCLAPFMAIYIGYNLWRYGAPLSFIGRIRVVQDQGMPVWGDPGAALSGLTIEPEKGLIWYAPLIVVTLPGLQALWQRHRALVAGALLCATLTLLILSPISAWRGDWAWGPRYLYGVAPLLHLGLPAALSVRGARRVLVLLLCGLAVTVQLAGASIPLYRHFLVHGIDLQCLYGLRQVSSAPPQWLSHLQQTPQILSHTQAWLDEVDVLRRAPILLTPALDLAAAPVTPEDIQIEGPGFADRYATFDTLSFFWIYHDLASGGLLRLPLRALFLLLILGAIAALRSAFQRARDSG